MKRLDADRLKLLTALHLGDLEQGSTAEPKPAHVTKKGGGREGKRFKSTLIACYHQWTTVRAS